MGINMASMSDLEKYYNKFNEEKRLDSRHGKVEFYISMKYIHECINLCKNDKNGTVANNEIKIMDVGAGTGRYSIALADEGYDVTAVELVKHNLGLLKAKNSTVKAYQGNALKLKRFDNQVFDITLLFGPMYHLFDVNDKVQALNEAKRITKSGGYILVAYVMNEYSIITYGFKERHIIEARNNNKISSDFHTLNSPSDLYDYVRIEDINKYNNLCGLKRYKILSPDGHANYMRPFLNKMSEEEFNLFIQYQLSVCERADLLGAGAHIVDILRV